ncbi:sensor histidine kinase [Bailinhaonella thermotolerans]|uniref:Sensor histidine kinase n=1 Tax=Bailinhaonella thermotolerans TaxID=1070861 RepID=A0A3A4B757_9ACTN|nr:sensor histidine kinase [Bailinhaonella thermotolerans]
MSTRVIAGVAVALFAGSMVLALSLPLVGTALERRSPLLVLAGAGVGLVLTICYSRVLWAAFMRRLTWRHYLDAAAVGLISYGVPAFGGPAWMAMPMAFISVAPIIVRRRAYALALTLASVAVTAVVLLLIDLPTAMALLYGLALLPTIAPMTYGMAWLCRIVDELRQARAELARRAVDEERVRFARDLHDTLGHTLQAIALRAELGERLVADAPDRALRELAEIQRIARTAVHDVREVVRGYRATSLAGELDGLAAVLGAAGISCERPEPPADLPAHVHEPLGWVAREAVTNVLRHSAATWCEVTVHVEDGHVVLEIVNDGGPGATRVVRGNGLTGLAERMKAAGGRLETTSGDGTFRVSAAVPLVPPPGPAEPAPARLPGEVAP